MQPLRPLSAVLGLVLLAVLVGGSDAASVQVTPAFTLKSAHVEAKYREGWLVGPKGAANTTGRVSFTVTLSTAAKLTAVLRRASREGSPFPARRTFNVRPGTSKLNLPLFRRHLPGVYRLRVFASTSVGALPPAERIVTLEAPVEGISRQAVVSATKYGRASTVLGSPRRQAWARFQFITPPRARTVKIQWKTPSDRLVCQTTGGPLPGCKLPLPYAKTVYTYLRSPGAGLQSGNWSCILSVGGRVAKRTFVRIR